MYTSYRLLEIYRQRSSENKQIENYVNSSGTTTTLDTTWLIVLALALILDIILIGFGTYYAIKCESRGKLPLWLAIVLIIFMWLPSPIQPVIALIMTIWGAVTGGCSK